MTITARRLARSVGRHLAGVAYAICIAALWAGFGGSETARLLRSGFRALDPELVLDVCAGLVVLGVGVRLAPVSTRAALVARGRSWGRRVRVPGASTHVVLAMVVAVAAVFRLALGLANHTPKVLGDELIYTGLGKGWALHAQPLLRGSRDVGQSIFYPLLLAPAFRFSHDGASALVAVRALDAVVIALAAIPAFVFARRVLPRRWAVGVAALSVSAPWTAYSALTLTESLFYPVFVTYAAVLTWALARPTVGRQVLLLATLAVLVGVRAQALAVAVGTVAAIVLLGALEAGVLVALRRFALTLVTFALVLAIGIGASAAGISVPTSAYNPVFDSVTRVAGMLKWGIWNMADFELALGVTMLAATPVALHGMLRRGATHATRAAGAVTLTLGLSLLASVALLSTSPYGLHRLHERNLFFVTPLLLTCFAHWLWSGLRRPLWLSGAAAVAAVALAATLGGGIVSHSNNVDAPAATFFTALEAQIPDVPVRVWIVLLAGLGAATFLAAKRPIFPILTVVLAFTAITSQIDHRDDLTATQARALAWVDHSLPSGAEATLVHLGLAYSTAPCAAAASAEEQDLAVWTEFFNTRIDAVAHVYEPNPRDGLASRELTVGHGGLILDKGKPFQPTYLVIDSRQPIVGTRLHRFDLSTIHSQYQNGASMTLWRVDPPLRFYSRPEPLPARADGRPC